MFRPSVPVAPPVAAKKLACGIRPRIFFIYPVVSRLGRKLSHGPGLITAVPPGQSAWANGVPSAFTLPKTLKQRNPLSVYGPPVGLNLGARGLPSKFTEAALPVGVAPGVAKEVGSASSAAPGFHPSQYRQMP